MRFFAKKFRSGECKIIFNMSAQRVTAMKSEFYEITDEKKAQRFNDL